VSLAVLVVAAPLMAALAVAVRHTSPGPAIFRQRRIGQRNREFELLKFRTLPADYVDRQLNADPEDYQCSFGRLLRRTSLDELPQIVNVLRGDMTLVGPRPERGYLVDQFSGEVHGYADRHRLPMGLTGLAQVEGMRGNDSIEDRARFDNYYIENWSSWQDMVILLRTPGAVLRSIREPMHPATGQVLLASDGEIEGVAGVRPVSPSS
jgi:lipopolysaccharide/colanic/teichoic acid biosynthesis glycosyltransferase